MILIMTWIVTSFMAKMICLVNSFGLQPFVLLTLHWPSFASWFVIPYNTVTDENMQRMHIKCSNVKFSLTFISIMIFYKLIMELKSYWTPTIWTWRHFGNVTYIYVMCIWERSPWWRLFPILGATLHNNLYKFKVFFLVFNIFYVLPSMYL